MTAVMGMLHRVVLQEDLNFLLTNRIPRRLATQLMARFSKLESRRLTKLSVALWRLFAPDLALDEAKQREFKSLHDVFIRELRDGARPIDPDPAALVSPCDAMVGAFGRVEDAQVVQAKGFPYTLMDLLGDPALVERHRNGHYITLRLRSSMYHRFHAPVDCTVRRVVYVSGDTWNVNPIALKRVAKLFCKNTRAILDLEPRWPGTAVTMVPIAAILVAGIQLRFVAVPLDLSHQGRSELACNVALAKGAEMGHFQSGSTIILFTSGGFELCPTLHTGATVRAGQRLMRRT